MVHAFVIVFSTKAVDPLSENNTPTFIVSPDDPLPPEDFSPPQAITLPAITTASANAKTLFTLFFIMHPPLVLVLLILHMEFHQLVHISHLEVSLSFLLLSSVYLPDHLPSFYKTQTGILAHHSDLPLN